MVLTYDLRTPPVLQKEAFLAKYGLNLWSAFFAPPQKTKVDQKLGPVDGLNLWSA